jgi:hypothetical protein
MKVRFEPPLEAIVVEDYDAAFPEAFNLCLGECVMLDREDQEWEGWVWCVDGKGRGGWVPQSFIAAHKDNGTGEMTCDYSAAELTIRTGDRLILFYEESGWYWTSNRLGHSGWVPSSHVKTL